MLKKECVPTEKDKVELALEYIYKYGGIDGEHHKQWVLDQVARILCDTSVLTFKITRHNETELIRATQQPSQKYLDMFTGDEEYGDFDRGIAP